MFVLNCVAQYFDMSVGTLWTLLILNSWFWMTRSCCLSEMLPHPLICFMEVTKHISQGQEFLFLLQLRNLVGFRQDLTYGLTL